MKLIVKDMTCGHCAGVITKAIKSLDATAKVEIDIAAKTVNVVSNVDSEDIIDAIADEGYEPALAKA